MNFETTTVEYTLAVFLSWVYLFALFSGIGLLCRRLFGLPVRHIDALFSAFWLGWAVAIFLLQLIHLVFPIDGRILLALSALGIAGLALHGGQISRIVRRVRCRHLWTFIPAIALVIFTANRALAAVVPDDDTGLYYLGMVQWNSTFPIVKGLGNLHGRFAFNNSHFLYAALLDVGPWDDRVFHIANGFLAAALLGQAVLVIDRAFLHPRPGYAAPYLLALMLAPIWSLVTTIEVTSLSTDHALAVLGIVLLWQLARLMTSNWTPEDDARFQLFSIFALSACGMTVKLSFVAFGGVTCLVAGWHWLRAHPTPPTRRQLSAAFVPATLIGLLGVGVWMVRGVLLSGYPAFPSTIGAVPVAWQVPRPLALSHANWIRSWARLPYVPWIDVLGNGDWFRIWVRNIPLYVPVTVLLTGAVITLRLLRLSLPRGASPWGNQRTHSPFWMLILPPLGGLLFWFRTAPAVRFSGSSFWLLLAATLLFVVDDERVSTVRRERIVRLGAAALMFVLAWRPPATLFVVLEEDGQLPSLPSPTLLTVSTPGGQPVNVAPPGDGMCWNAPLPCTVYFRSNLRLLVPGELSQGFYLDKSMTYADFQAPILPAGVTAPANLGVASMSWPIADHYPARIREANRDLRFLLYTEYSGPVTATITVSPDTVAGLETRDARVELLLDDRTIAAFTAGDSPVTVSLPLQQEFNVLAVRVPDRALLFSGLRLGMPGGMESGATPIELSGIDFARPE